MSDIHTRPRRQLASAAKRDGPSANQVIGETSRIVSTKPVLLPPFFEEAPTEYHQREHQTEVAAPAGGETQPGNQRDLTLGSSGDTPGLATVSFPGRTLQSS